MAIERKSFVHRCCCLVLASGLLAGCTSGHAPATVPALNTVRAQPTATQLAKATAAPLMTMTVTAAPRATVTITRSVSVPAAAGPVPSRTAPSNELVPADDQFPAAGSCATSSARLVEIDVNPDVPTPRCVILSAEQGLTVLNATARFGEAGVPVVVSWADYAPLTLSAGASTTFPRPVGEYLARGVHHLHLSKYGTSSAEIWFR